MNSSDCSRLGLMLSISFLALVLMLFSIHLDLAKLNETLQHIEVSIVAASPDEEQAGEN